VTEPVEFGFMFLAPALYAVHAVLTGVSMALMHIMHVRLGFTFSAGLFDFLLSSGKGENPMLMLPVGVAYFVVYYVIFSFAIRKFDLMTLGREETMVPVVNFSAAPASNRARDFVAALGGGANLKSVDACTTRLRLEVVDGAAINEAALKALGSRGMIKPAAGSVQVVLGPEADLVADEIRQFLHQDHGVERVSDDHSGWWAALGGERNVFAVEPVAGSRLRVEVADAARVDHDALKKLGAIEVVPFSSNLLHVVLETDAAPTALALSRPK
jgi:PTS system N-acetylglucosamine-specific IIC component